jgi:hypothetical protein
MSGTLCEVEYAQEVRLGEAGSRHAQPRFHRAALSSLEYVWWIRQVYQPILPRWNLFGR